MDFELSEDQVALVDGIRSLLQGRFDIESVRAVEGTTGVDRAAWRELAETGVFSLVLPEADGGVEEAVASLEHHDHDVVLVDDLGAEPAGILDHLHPETPGVLEQRRDPLVVLAEAAELVVVLARHMTREDEHVQHVGHLSARRRRGWRTRRRTRRAAG